MEFFKEDGVDIVSKMPGLLMQLHRLRTECLEFKLKMRLGKAVEKQEVEKVEEVAEEVVELKQKEKAELEDELSLERECLAQLEKIKKMASELRSYHDVSSATHQQVKLKSELKEVLGEAVEMWQTLWQREKAELEGELFLERERLAKLAIDAEEAEGN